jgi:hypothetical protein
MVDIEQCTERGKGKEQSRVAQAILGLLPLRLPLAFAIHSEISHYRNLTSTNKLFWALEWDCFYASGENIISNFICTMPP